MKNRITLIWFGFILAINTLSVYSQFDYRKGHIVTNEGDTVKGYIEYGNARNNAYYCYFKIDSTSKPYKYLPDELISITVGNYRHSVSKDIYINGKKQRLFLEYLLKGAMDLYFFIDQNSADYYFVEKEGVLYELTNDPTEKTIDGKTYIGTTNKYIRTLNYLTKESPATSKLVEKMDFSPKSFIKIATDYHEYICDSVDCVVYSREQRRLNDAKIQIRVGVSVGNSFTRLENRNEIHGGSFFVGYDEYELRLISSNLGEHFGENHLVFNEFFVFPGLYINISRNRELSFQLELWYKNQKYSTEQLFFEHQNISIPFIIKRDFLFYKKISPYINVGLSYNYHFYFKAKELNIEYLIVDDRGNAIGDTRNISKHDYSYLSNKKSTLGVLIGCGMNYNINESHSLNIEIRRDLSGIYEKILPMDSNVSLSSMFIVKSTILKLGYSYSF